MFEFLRHVFRVLEMMFDIFLAPHAPYLDECSQGENATNNPIQYVLIIVNLACDQDTAKYEYTIAE